jgi:hypothetical protein
MRGDSVETDVAVDALASVLLDARYGWCASAQRLPPGAVGARRRLHAVRRVV